MPSRATLFTGQYPSLHGVAKTDGTAKQNTDPAMGWLDPDEVPTLGDWFRAGGYQTHYRGKWHVSHADLAIPGGHVGLMASDDDGRPIPEAVAAYRKADRLDQFGFSGWIGREPHGAAKCDSGTVRDGVFAEQVTELFADLAAARADGPWLSVASFVNPHDIAFAGGLYELLLGFAPTDGTVPEIPEAPSQADSFAGRPACQEQFKGVWPRMVAEQPADLAYRQLYYYLHKIVDGAIGRILEALESSGMADDTIVVFTSDHGDLLGAHGGLQQKWCNAFDAVDPPCFIESVVAPLPTGADGVVELWKLNHYYERLDDWDAEHGRAPSPFAGPAADPAWELHNLTADPQERHNLADDTTAPLGDLQAVLAAERDAKRLVPSMHNP